MDFDKEMEQVVEGVFTKLNEAPLTLANFQSHNLAHFEFPPEVRGKWQTMKLFIGHDPRAVLEVGTIDVYVKEQ